MHDEREARSHTAWALKHCIRGHIMSQQEIAIILAVAAALDEGRYAVLPNRGLEEWELLLHLWLDDGQKPEWRQVAQKLIDDGLIIPAERPSWDDASEDDEPPARRYTTPTASWT
ncbi:hypothetical protein [Kineosporia sp. R_H_3]|uniref:hypothetical protein n=1 Tax=Kineosporia sp. R_H_3 TaxID=1961848 RepID=UPI000B4A6349|nr:hypothetical protein [Kineosporia sp. R_H_3]